MSRKSAKASASSQQAPKSAGDTSNTSSAPVVIPFNEGAKTFFDLPGEIRNQIYGELLPDVPDLANLPWGDGLRSDGQRTSTAFMATCKAVHDEAVSVLYDSFSTTEGEVELYIDNAGNVIFLGHSISLADATPGNFSAIKRVAKLRLRVSTSSPSAYSDLCNLQDAMFVVFSDTLQSGHALQSLQVHIYTPGHDDGFLGMVSSIHADFMYPRMVMREFMDVRPGDVSRAHVAAFLTDPLRTIRGVKNGKKKGKFALEFVGKGGRPWRDIQGAVRGLVQGDWPVPNYKVFCDYFATVRQLYAVGNKFPGLKARNHPLTQLAKARIQGDVAAFHKGHGNLLDHIDRVCRKWLDPAQAKSSDEAQLREEAGREMIYLGEVLTAKLPPADTQTSFFGYVVADEGLKEWQTHGRAAEKEAKAKRKRERESAGDAKGKGRKKARMG